MERLQASLPADLSIVERLALEHTNRSYITALYDMLNMSVLAAPLVGISNELAAYLRSVPQHEMDVAISERPVPLFHWRFADEMFWLETHAGRLTRELIAHFLMESSPMRTDKLPHSSRGENSVSRISCAMPSSKHSSTSGAVPRACLRSSIPVSRSPATRTAGSMADRRRLASHLRP